jgi:lipoate-protein ligase A
MQIDSPTQWRLLPYSAGPAAHELAAGDAMLAGLAQEPRAALRWYGAAGLALVLGSGQRPSDADGAALAAAGATLHKRASGGTAVLFAPGLIMQDIALPATHPLRRDDVSESYSWLGQTWVDALAALGVAADLVDIPAARADGSSAGPLVRRACFGGRSPYEVLAGGRKLVGFSQIRRRQGALFQVGVYTRWPGRELAQLLRAADDERAALTAALAGRVAGLDELLPVPPAPAALAAAFAEALRRRHGVELAPAGWQPAEQAALAAALPRYEPIEQAATMPPYLAS